MEDWSGQSDLVVFIQNRPKLTYLHNFSAIILLKIFIAKEVPPFHLRKVICLIFRVLYKVELWVEYGWNYIKFHPYSTYNSTLRKLLIIKVITIPRWKGGITNDKNYFSWNSIEKVLTTVKNWTKHGSHQENITVNPLKK